jgi:hypothetical protein
LALTWLHTDGKYIKNEYGTTVFLRGVALGDLSWRIDFQGGITYRINQLVKLTAGKVTVIRVAISHAPSTYGWALDTPEVFDPAMDELMSVAVANNIYVWTNFHGTYDPDLVNEFKRNPTRLINWHLHFINRYKDIPNFLGIEVWNEPPTDYLTWTEWRNISQQVYNAVRAANPKALIIVAGYDYSRINQEWVDNPLGAQAVYSWDSYWYHLDYNYYQKPYYDGDYTTGYARMLQYLLDWANIGAPLPIICSEFGWRPQDNLQACNDWFKIMNLYDNNWACWMWWGNPANYGLATDSTYTELTPHGKILAQYLSGLPPSYKVRISSSPVVTPIKVDGVSLSGEVLLTEGVHLFEAPTTINLVGGEK